jgi:hypothetical protein
MAEAITVHLRQLKIVTVFQDLIHVSPLLLELLNGAFEPLAIIGRGRVNVKKI